MKLLFVLLLFVLNYSSCLIPPKDYKPNVFVITDISNEPDDAESLVRLLLYTNEISLKGIVATTSFWLNDTVHEEDIYPILDAYEKVHEKLLKHSSDYPSAKYLRSIVSSSHSVYGLECFNMKKVSAGAVSLVDAVDALPLGEILHVLVWGGALVIAEALKEVSKRSDADEFTKKLHVYAISDQDDSGPWIRYNFPRIPYIASVHGFNQYGLSTWVGISGEIYNSFDYGGPDSHLVSKEWLREKIQNIGILGAAYPDYMFNMEGDTPSTLSIIPNGLNEPLHPEYGGWGGRYILSDLSGRSKHYADAADYVVGQNNVTFVSNKLTIWRWREAFQNDFALRMQWTIKDFELCTHAPIVIVNSSDSIRPMELSLTVGSKIILDASKSYDLNGKDLIFKWFHYYDISLTQGNRLEVPEIEIISKNSDNSMIEFEVPNEKQACCTIFGKPKDSCKSYHIILEVSNVSDTPVKAYRRFIIDANRDPGIILQEHDEL